MRLVSLDGAQSVDHPVHGPAAAGEDGVFDLPEEFAKDLLRHAGQWVSEAEQLAGKAKAALRELANPRAAQRVLAEVRQDVEVLKAEVERLLAEKTPKPKAAPKK